VTDRTQARWRLLEPLTRRAAQDLKRKLIQDGVR